MERVFLSLRPVIRFAVKRPGIVLAAAMLLTVIGVANAIKLTVDPDFAKLLPSNYPSVQAIERLRQTVGGSSEAAVAIVSPSSDANRAYAEALLPVAMAQRATNGTPYFTRAEYRKDVEFIKDNALYLASDAELSELEAYLEEEKEQAVLEENPFFFDLDDDEEDAPSSETRRESMRAVYDRLVASEYPESEDGTTLVLRFHPADAQTNIGFIDDAYRILDSVTTALNPASYHPEMQIVLAGRLQRSLIEIRAITDDLFSSFGAGVATVLLIVIVYFQYKSLRSQRGRPWTAARLFGTIARLPALMFVIAVPLLMSLSWTFGVAYLSYGSLNLMTATLGLVLFGLGVDFGIHFYGRYAEERSEGATPAAAAETTFSSTGQAVATGAFTTAAAFYSLLIADFKGFSEFGFIAGTGVLLALSAMLIVLPALLVVFEKYGILELEPITAAQSLNSTRSFPLARGIVLVALALVVWSFFYVPPYFEYEFGKLEPVYTEYNNRRDVIRRVQGGDTRRNPAYVITDTPEEVPDVVAALRELRADSTTTIADIESIQERIPPTPDLQRAKLERIAAIRDMLDDPAIADDTHDIDLLRRAAQTTRPVTVDQIPDFIKAPFTSKTGEIGNFVIIYPRYGLSDGRQSIAFADEVGSIAGASGATYHAASQSIIAADMLKLMRQEAPWMVAITFTVVVVLMLLNFGSVRYAALATVPLVVGIMWMLLLMGLLDMKLNFYNLVVLPAVLGIGNDAGVHIVHRYRERGKGSVMAVLRSTGEQVIACSLTTMVGFSGPLLSFHPGLRSIGALAVIGIGTTLIASIVFLPALLQRIEKRS